jgi:lactoylglutathione lyase
MNRVNGKIKKMKIDHVAFEVNDLDTSIRFYTGLGFREQIRLLDENEHESLAILEIEGGKLELIQVLSEKNEPKPFEPVTLRPHFCPHIALQVDNLQAMQAHLETNGTGLVHGPLEIPGAAKWLYVCDPDRNVIEFFQELSTTL